MVEINYRLALPIACLVLALVAAPIGLITRKGGKAFGLMLSILLVFIYYVLMAFGLSLAKQGPINPVVGLWTANVAFGVAGLFMLHQTNRVRTGVDFLHAGLAKIGHTLERFHIGGHKPAAEQNSVKPAVCMAGFPDS